jgi:hypothetical protein
MQKSPQLFLLDGLGSVPLRERYKTIILEYCVFIQCMVSSDLDS